MVKQTSFEGESYVNIQVSNRILTVINIQWSNENYINFTGFLRFHIEGILP